MKMELGEYGMNTYLLRLVACLIFACFFSLNSKAAYNVVLDTQNGQLVGAFNVNVNGFLYDVEFIDGTCIALFNGCDDPSDFTFTTGIAALSASNALHDQVLIGPFDDDQTLTRGCDVNDYGVCAIVTSYFWDPSKGTVEEAVALNFSGSGWHETNIVEVDPNYDCTFDELCTRAVWTAVPLPAGIYLFLSGLVGLGLMRGRNA